MPPKRKVLRSLFKISASTGVLFFSPACRIKFLEAVSQFCAACTPIVLPKVDFAKASCVVSYRTESAPPDAVKYSLNLRLASCSPLVVFFAPAASRVFITPLPIVPGVARTMRAAAAAVSVPPAARIPMPAPFSAVSIVPLRIPSSTPTRSLLRKRRKASSRPVRSVSSSVFRMS